MGLGSGIRKKPIPDPGSRGQKSTGYRILDSNPQHCRKESELDHVALHFASKRNFFKAKPAHPNSYPDPIPSFTTIKKFSICFYFFTVLPVHTGCFSSAS
jgi:hypothetical protein